LISPKLFGCDNYDFEWMGLKDKESDEYKQHFAYVDVDSYKNLE
jgi:hypothetical protein